MKNIKYIILAISLFYIILFSSLEFVSVNKPIYYYQYSLNKVYDIDYVKEYPVENVTDDIILFLADLKNNMNEREYFNYKENKHMEDVKVLFEIGSYVRLICLVLLVYLISNTSKEKDFIKKIISTYLGIICVFITFIFILSRNFSLYFVKFHHVFFNNDDWLLNPAESIIINLMPENFFVNFAIYIFIGLIILSFLLNLTIIYLKKRT